MNYNGETDVYTQKLETRIPPFPLFAKQSKLDQNLHIRPETIREKHKETLQDIGTANNILAITPKASNKIDKQDLSN